MSRGAGVGGGAYRREVRFYQELAPRISMRTPRCFYADIDEASGDFIVLMEDMSPAAPGDQIRGCDVDVAAVAVAEAVGLHAPFWNDPTLTSHDWLTPSTPDAALFAQTLLQQFWPGFCERFGNGLHAESVALGQRFVDGYVDWFAGYKGPLTLIHADYRLENMLLAPPGSGAGIPPITIVDWQTAAQGCGLADVAYFLGGGLTVENRRAYERGLVGEYCARMRAKGIELSDEEGWRFYRRFSLHGVLITVLGAMVTGQDPRGDRMFLAMAQRHLQHALDLFAEELSL
jgi:aminoglycoside/choline kinase family phosphotransferase